MGYGDALREHRTEAGFTLMDAAYELRTRLPKALWVSVDTIRRMETGSTPEEKADPLLLTALADVYGCGLADLSEVAAESLESLRDLLVRTSR